MTKYTQKQLKELVKLGVAADITNGDENTKSEILKKEGYCTQIGYSHGIYGCNGKLLRGNKTGTLYAITARTTAIFIFQEVKKNVKI